MISATAQAAVAADSLLVIASDVVQAANDKQQTEPMLDKLHDLPAELGKPTTLLADHGYFSAANVTALPMGADRALDRRGPTTASPIVERPLRRAAAGTGEPNPGRGHAPPPGDETEGKKLYALRKQIPEPVFGIIKSALGFR